MTWQKQKKHKKFYVSECTCVELVVFKLWLRLYSADRWPCLLSGIDSWKRYRRTRSGILSPVSAHWATLLSSTFMPALGGNKRYRDPSVCLSRGAAACLGYRHIGCLQLSYHRLPEMCRLRSRPRTDIDPLRFLDPRWPDWRRNDMPPSNCHRRGAYRLATPGRYLVQCDVMLAR